MSRVAPRIHTDAARIARLEALALQLPQDDRVAITRDDGGVVQGIVSAMPTVQLFFDPRGREGINALVQVEADDGSVQLLWLDAIEAVSPLPNPSPPQPSRAQPPDPNAPTVERNGTVAD